MELNETYCIHREKGDNEDLEDALLEKDEKYVTGAELKAHQALDDFAKYVKSFEAHEKAEAYQARMKEEREARSKTDELQTKRMESDVHKKKLALSFPKEDYLSVKKTFQEATRTIKDRAANI